MELPEKLKTKLKALPDKPGCYLMRDQNGKIIYVGKARSLRKRVQSYFRDASLRSATPKVRGLVKSVQDLDIIVVHNEAAAVLTEGKLIKTYRPRYNVSFKDDKRFLLLRANPDDPFPRFSLVRIRRDDGARYFGPYASANAARTTLDFVEKQFGVRKCTPRMPDSETYKHCINDIVRFCTAPCIGKITKTEYHVRFNEACAFLGGHRPEFLKMLRAQMDEASQALDFERAAALRDTLFLLQKAVKQHARVAPTQKMQQEAAASGVAQLQTALSLPSPPQVIEAFDISNISGTYAVASMVCAVGGIPRSNRYRRFRIKTVEGSNDPAMIAEVVRRRVAGLLKKGAPLPDLILVDGGITQLRAARRVLAELDCAALPTAGLAKRYEEVFWDESGPPLRLPRDSDALKVLQRLRDEAHRFAITYHRQLRSKRIRESVLDDVPGIGPKRKQRILAHFGSIRKLQNAGQEGLAAVPGIGPEFAKVIWKALESPQNAQREPDPES
jgi:excinuclease ABC subunit C